MEVDVSMNLLDRILGTKRARLIAQKTEVPESSLSEKAMAVRRLAKPHALVEALRNSDRVNIIAEFKRRSPSRGAIRENADPVTIARRYQSAGAAAVSVLTEEDNFEGSLDDLRVIRDVVSIPILRKDFIVDDYQVYESAAAGADALLLIVAALDNQTLARLLSVTETELGMDALVEVHTKNEMDRAVASGATLIGVNNRDLRSFEVSTKTSLELVSYAPANLVLVSESGLSPSDVPQLRAVGFKGFLVGEALMRADDPERELQLFLESF